jgi:hypothetical protein
MAEPVRKTVPSTTVSPLHEETAESPRPHAVPQAAPTGKRSKEQTSGADTVRRFAGAIACAGRCSPYCRSCCSPAAITT